METTVYVFDASALKDITVFERALALCPEFRRDKALSYKHDEDKRLSVAAWLVLTKALEPFGIDVFTARVVYGKNGKPCFAEHTDAHFSISHSTDMVLCAVSDCEIGCDIEAESKFRPDVVFKRFHSEEKTAIESEPTLLTRIWTLKESFVKCTGEGLTRALDSFSVCRKGRIIDRIISDGGSYFLHELDAPTDYRAACCVKLTASVKPAVRQRELSLSDVL